LGKRFSGRIAYYILGGCTMKRKLVSLMLVVSMTAAMVAGCGSDDKKTADNNAAGTEKTDDSKEAANFLKNEYGTGGSTHALAGADHSYEDHDAKGIKLQKGNIGKPYAEVLLSWNVVEKRIRKLIEEDKYLSPEGKEAYAQYRVEQEQKALEQTQAKMEHETKVACKNAIEKAIAEKFDGYRLPKDTAIWL